MTDSRNLTMCRTPSEPRHDLGEPLTRQESGDWRKTPPDTVTCLDLRRVIDRPKTTMRSISLQAKIDENRIGRLRKWATPPGQGPCFAEPLSHRAGWHRPAASAGRSICRAEARPF